MSIEKVRLENLLQLVAQYDSKTLLAQKIGMSGQQLNQLLTERRNIGEKVARKIEAALNLDPCALDVDRNLGKTEHKLLQEMPMDQLSLLSDYEKLSVAHRHVVRELVAIYAKVDSGAL